MGSAIFAGDVGRALDELVDSLGATATLDLQIRAPMGLLTLPFESALLPSGRAPALLPAVRMWRTLPGSKKDGGAPGPPPAPGPLKILVAVGAPDGGQNGWPPRGTRRALVSDRDPSPVPPPERPQAPSPDDVRLVHLLVGGHPRVLELVDALLRRGASVDRVRPKLRELARKEGIDPRADRDLAAAVSDAVRLGARDIVLTELMDALDVFERTVLPQVAVSGLPVSPEDIRIALDADGLSTDAVEQAARRLIDLSLLVAMSEGLWVHRWTAEALRSLQPEDEYKDRCHRAGAMRLYRLTSAPRGVSEGIEAVENFLAAGDIDEAAAIGVSVANFLSASSARTLAGFAARLRAALPTSHPSYKLIADHEATALLALGFTRPAIQRYSELLLAHQHLVATEPDRADYQRDLSVSYERLGNLMVAVGKGEEAARLYEQPLAIARRLAEAEPDRADYQRDLTLGLQRLGQTWIENDPGKADALWHEALNLAMRNLEREPDRPDLATDLSLSLCLLAQTDDDPVPLLGKAVDILKSFAERLPQNVAVHDYGTTLRSKTWDHLGRADGLHSWPS